MGTAADGSALVAAAFEAFNRHDVERLDDLFAEDWRSSRSSACCPS